MKRTLTFSLIFWGIVTTTLWAASPTVKLYKVLKDNRKRECTIVPLQKTSDGGYILRIPQKELETMEFLLVTPSMAVGHQGERGWFINNDGLQTCFSLPHKQRCRGGNQPECSS